MQPGTLDVLGMNPQAAYALLFMAMWMFPTAVVATVAPRLPDEAWAGVYRRWLLPFGLWAFAGLFAARFGWDGIKWIAPGLGAFIALAFIVGLANKNLRRDLAGQASVSKTKA
ncbi:MAG: hypothetical protein QOF58_2945 [Pseudonocardiales bacterium]|jgi:hypothetical protein|nr:hypothetical protein [Pseudonocardiales bacterium]